ncbi:hypothetical protein CC86DRAFT_64688 [Ophiobolus disseminans]|uniref:Uncharacterized protein n=1 Tax=Ophiobolus disseminans TaxID=1469910 RepID=A0A6A6ZRZ1_9PLEO|nr:hypothetical protein CC86DRAFT_64688 [Ophiobolus disseminans]
MRTIISSSGSSDAHGRMVVGDGGVGGGGDSDGGVDSACCCVEEVGASCGRQGSNSDCRKEQRTEWESNAGRARAGCTVKGGGLVEMSVGISGVGVDCCCGVRAWAGFVTSVSLFWVVAVPTRA